MDDPSIERLRDSTKTKLRSTQILTSLPQIVSELFQNSLDADAKHIEIGVNCAEWSCWVRDDGSGMNKDSMNTLGTEGRYGTSTRIFKVKSNCDALIYIGTSKAYAPDSLNCLSTFGFRGEGYCPCVPSHE